MFFERSNTPKGKKLSASELHRLALCEEVANSLLANLVEIPRPMNINEQWIYFVFQQDLGINGIGPHLKLFLPDITSASYAIYITILTEFQKKGIAYQLIDHDPAFLSESKHAANKIKVIFSLKNAQKITNKMKNQILSDLLTPCEKTTNELLQTFGISAKPATLDDQTPGYHFHVKLEQSAIGPHLRLYLPNRSSIAYDNYKKIINELIVYDIKIMMAKEKDFEFAIIPAKEAIKIVEEMKQKIIMENNPKFHFVLKSMLMAEKLFAFLICNNVKNNRGDEHRKYWRWRMNAGEQYDSELTRFENAFKKITDKYPGSMDNYIDAINRMYLSSLLPSRGAPLAQFFEKYPAILDFFSEEFLAPFSILKEAAISLDKEKWLIKNVPYTTRCLNKETVFHENSTTPKCLPFTKSVAENFFSRDELDQKESMSDELEPCKEVANHLLETLVDIPSPLSMGDQQIIFTFQKHLDNLKLCLPDISNPAYSIYLNILAEFAKKGIEYQCSFPYQVIDYDLALMSESKQVPDHIIELKVDQKLEGYFYRIKNIFHLPIEGFVKWNTDIHHRPIKDDNELLSNKETLLPDILNMVAMQCGEHYIQSIIFLPEYACMITNTVRNQILHDLLVSCEKTANELLKSFVMFLNSASDDETLESLFYIHKTSITTPHLRLYIPNKPYKMNNAYKRVIDALMNKNVNIMVVKERGVLFAIVPAKEAVKIIEVMKNKIVMENYLKKYFILEKMLKAAHLFKFCICDDNQKERSAFQKYTAWCNTTGSRYVPELERFESEFTKIAEEYSGSMADYFEAIKIMTSAIGPYKGERLSRFFEKYPALLDFFYQEFIKPTSILEEAARILDQEKWHDTENTPPYNTFMNRFLNEFDKDVDENYFETYRLREVPMSVMTELEYKNDQPAQESSRMYEMDHDLAETPRYAQHR